MVNWEQVINEMELPELPPPPPVFRMPSSEMGRRFNDEMAGQMQFIKRQLEHRILYGAPKGMCVCGGQLQDTGALCDFGADGPTGLRWFRCRACGTLCLNS